VGIKASKAGNNKVAKDEYVTAGTKAGMVGTGALIGTAIMPGLGTLIGAGIGGAVALLTGDKAGKALSDATDKDGALSKFWENTKTWASNTWDSIKTGASNALSWISDKWSGFSDWFETSIWTPTKDVGISAINIAAGAWMGEQFTAAKNAISEAWSGVSGWFEQKVWEPIKTGAAKAWEWVGEKLGGIGEWIGDKWQSFKDWLGGLGQKGSKETGLTTSQGKGSVLEHAYGRIMTKPHMGIVAEDGAEGIIPLSPSKRQRGLDLWQRTGELLGVRAYEDGGIVGEEPDEIPVASATGKPARTSPSRWKSKQSLNSRLKAAETTPMKTKWWSY